MMFGRFMEVLGSLGILALAVLYIVMVFVAGFKLAEVVDDSRMVGYEREWPGFLVYLLVVVLGIAAVPAGFYVVNGG